MSDLCPVRDPLIHICDPPERQLTYVSKQREGGNEVVLWLAIKNAALIQWHKLKMATPGIAYIDMLNGVIPGRAFKINRESERIEGRLSNRCSAASITNQTLNRQGNHKNRKEHDQKLCRVAVLKNEMISVKKWEADLRSIQSKLEKGGEENMKIWRKKRRNWLKKCCQRLKRKEQENCPVKIDILENDNLGIHRGAEIPDLKTKQAQNRK